MLYSHLPHHFLALAPMEGVTDVIFRQVIAKAGKPDLFYTEFTNVSSYASEKGRANALERMRIAPSDRPIIAQIWGKNPEHFSEFAHALSSLGFSGVDINMGCPDRHVNKAGGGAAMIRTPDLAMKCIKNAKTATSLPLSVKTRLGYTYPEEHEKWLELLLEQNLAALTVHLRTRKEMSKVPAHYELIPNILRLRAQIAPETKIIVNGDIRDKQHAEELWQQHPEIDGFMIGRGVFANPYCFTTHHPEKSELLDLLNYHLDLFDQNITEINPETVIATKIPKTAKLATATKAPGNNSEPAPHSFEPLKKFFKIYLNNFPGAKDLRTQLMECKTTSEARQILQDSV